jgi:hypothetical protein
MRRSFRGLEGLWLLIAGMKGFCHATLLLATDKNHQCLTLESPAILEQFMHLLQWTSCRSKRNDEYFLFKPLPEAHRDR